MTDSRTDLLQGTLDLLILKALTVTELHGMGISRRIAQITNGTFEVKPGSLFPALHRMEEVGWLSSFWGEADTNRHAKFYRLPGWDGVSSTPKPNSGNEYRWRWRALYEQHRNQLEFRDAHITIRNLDVSPSFTDLLGPG